MRNKIEKENIDLPGQQVTLLVKRCPILEAKMKLKNLGIKFSFNVTKKQETYSAQYCLKTIVTFVLFIRVLVEKEYAY